MILFDCLEGSEAHFKDSYSVNSAVDLNSRTGTRDDLINNDTLDKLFHQFEIMMMSVVKDVVL